MTTDNKTLAVDVLAVMDAATDVFDQENWTLSKIAMEEARAAVAELIEADQAYDYARRNWCGEKYEGDDYGVLGSDFIRCMCCEGESGAGILNRGVTHEPNCEVAILERAESCRSAALARVKGEAA